MNFTLESRREVLLHIEKYMLEKMHDYLKPIDTNWQPADLLPDSCNEDFYTEIKGLRENAKDRQCNNFLNDCQAAILPRQG